MRAPDVHRTAVVLEFSGSEIYPSLILPRKVHIDTPQEFYMGSFKTNVRYFSSSASMVATLTR